MSMQAFAASDDEAELAAQLLKIAKCEEAGALPASLAVDFFGRSGLTVEQLRDIWNLADQNGSGDLSKDEVAMAIRLMGWAQAGEALDSGLLRKS
jgi:epidermal growth factor receptor substrate 15